MTNGRQKWNISKSLCSRKSAGFTADHNQDFFLLTCGNGSMLDFNSPSLPPGSWCRRWCQTESQRNSGSSTSSNLQKKKKNPVERTNLHSHGATLDFLRRYSRVRWGIFLPVLALKYDESASSRETERPMSTDGSHSSPRCSWVGEDGGGGWWMGEGGSEEEADERFMVRFDLNPFVSNWSNRLLQVRDVGLPLGWFDDAGRSTFCFSAVPSSSKRLSEGQPESVAWDRMQSSSNTWRKRMGRRKRIFMSAGVWLMCMFLKLDFRL